MRTLWTVSIAVVLLIVLGLYAVTFQVGYNEAAMLRTFGSPGAVFEGSAAKGTGVVGNLHFKWPWPFQDVLKYDMRVRVLEAPQEQTRTADSQSVVVQHFVAWRISEPLSFLESLGSVDNAEEQLLSRMRTGLSKIAGDYTFDDLTNVDPGALKLGEIEQRLAETLQDQINARSPQAEGDAESASYGITIESVGIHRVLLTDDATPNVFASMTTTQDRLAADIQSDGESEAQRIVAEGESNRRRILSFAGTYAKQIEAEGVRGMGQQMEAFNVDPDFAIFLRKIETAKLILPKQTTFVVGTDHAPFDLFRQADQND